MHRILRNFISLSLYVEVIQKQGHPLQATRARAQLAERSQESALALPNEKDRAQFVTKHEPCQVYLVAHGTLQVLKR